MLRTSHPIDLSSERCTTTRQTIDFSLCQTIFHTFSGIAFPPIVTIDFISAKMSSEEIELWNQACENCKIPSYIAEHWLNRILQKYDTESQRSYHNSQILRTKSELILELNALNQVKSIAALVFAIFFQYYEFDVKSNCSDINCNAFRLFCNESNVDDVSTIQLKKKLNGILNDEKRKYFLHIFSREGESTRNGVTITR